MGLSIHYRGGINHITDIPVLVDELEDIANSMGWASRRFNIDENNPNFRGILIKPNGDREPLWFLFDLEGKLRSLLGLITEHMDPTESSYTITTKTHFASVETHAWIIGLLSYLQKHYLGDLIVKDEGGYWDTKQLDTLKAKRQLISEKLDQLAEGLESETALPENTSLDSLVENIETRTKRQS